MLHKNLIYPVFLPHAGCPFQCVYCNQRAVASLDFRNKDINDLVESRLKAYSIEIEKSGRPGEIAFFGGTFTALPPVLMEFILSAAAILLRQGIFTGIRFSTRPDCMGEEVVRLLSKYPVRTVELGVQSMSDTVLKASRRGYFAKSVLDAAERVRDKGWDLGIQLMAGLPGDTRELFLESVRAVIGMSPDFLRIYPTLVLEGTQLAESFKTGMYTPLSIDEAVEWVTTAYSLAVETGIPLARMGLHADPALEKPGVVLGGPYHPAFGHLVKCRWWRERVDLKISVSREFVGSHILLRTAPNQISDVIGHKKSNLQYWKQKWDIEVKVIGEASLDGIEMLLQRYK